MHPNARRHARTLGYRRVGCLTHRKRVGMGSREPQWGRPSCSLRPCRKTCRCPSRRQSSRSETLHSPQSSRRLPLLSHELRAPRPRRFDRQYPLRPSLRPRQLQCSRKTCPRSRRNPSQPPRTSHRHRSMGSLPQTARRIWNSSLS